MEPKHDWKCVSHGYSPNHTWITKHIGLLGYISCLSITLNHEHKVWLWKVSLMDQSVLGISNEDVWVQYMIACVFPATPVFPVNWEIRESNCCLYIECISSDVYQVWYKLIPFLFVRLADGYGEWTAKLRRWNTICTVCEYQKVIFHVVA